jgi:cyclopropane fatty-acyl-phospholipid synthase-like methyltransferase
MPWYVDFFDKDYITTYAHLTPELTRTEADFIEKTLALEAGHRILDIPCGFGRHSIELASRGYSVTGMEYNLPQIDHARKLMLERGVQFEIIQADMRDIPCRDAYDRAFNYFTSFGFFSDEENEATVGQFYKALKPGGLFLMEVVNRDYIYKNYRPCSVTRLKGGSLLIDERTFDPLTSRMHSTHTYVNAGAGMTSRSLELRMYSPHELLGIFRRNGFEIVKLYGSGGAEFEMFSSRIALVARKPQ